MIELSKQDRIELHQTPAGCAMLDGIDRCNAKRRAQNRKDRIKLLLIVLAMLATIALIGYSCAKPMPTGEVQSVAVGL